MSQRNPDTGSDSVLGNEPATRFDAHEFNTGMVTVGTNGEETVSETDSPTGFSFHAGSGRDLQYEIEVVLSNSTTSTQTVGITVSLADARMYDGDDGFTGDSSDTGDQLRSEYQEVTIDAGASGGLPFFNNTEPLANRNVYVDVATDNSNVSVDRTNVTTIGGTYRTTIDEGGGRIVQDHFGRNVEEIDPIDGGANFPHALKRDEIDVIDHGEIGAGIEHDADRNLQVAAGNGLRLNSGLVEALIDRGLTFTNGAIEVNPGGGIELNNGLVKASPAPNQGTEINGYDNIGVIAGSAIGTDSNGVNVRQGRGLEYNSGTNRIENFIKATSGLFSVGLVGNTEDTLDLNTGPGIRKASDQIETSAGDGLVNGGGEINVDRGVDSGLFFSSSGLEVGAANGIIKSGGQIGAHIKDGLFFDSNGIINVDLGTDSGLFINSNEGLEVGAANGIIKSAGEIGAHIKDGLFFDSNGIINVDLGTDSGLFINSNEGLEVGAANGIIKSAGEIGAHIKDGLFFDSNGIINVDLGTDSGLFINSNEGLEVGTAKGVQKSGGNVGALIDDGLGFDSNGAIDVTPATQEGVQINGSENVGVKNGRGIGFNGSGQVIVRASGNEFGFNSGQLNLNMGDGLDSGTGGVFVNSDGTRGMDTTSSGVAVKVAGGLNFNSTTGDIYTDVGRGLAIEDGILVNTNVSSDGGTTGLSDHEAPTAEITSENDHQNITVSGPTATFELDSLPAPFDNNQPGNVQLTPLDRPAGESSWHVAYMRPDALKIDFHSDIPSDEELNFRLSLLE